MTCDTMALRASGLLASFTSMIVGRPDDSTARMSAYPVPSCISEPNTVRRGEPASGSS